MNQKYQAALQKAAIAHGMTCEEMEEIVQAVKNEFGTTRKNIEQFHNVTLGLPYDSSKKAKRMVVCDNIPRYGPPPARGKDCQRSRSRRRQDNLLTSGRADESKRFPLSRVSEDRLAARVLDDANRIVSTDTVDR